MEQPNVWSEIRDAEKGITYQVLAYRALSREELVQAVQFHHASIRLKPKLKPKRGDTVRIETIMGYRD